MEKQQMKAAIEAVLFTMGKSVPADVIANALEIEKKEAIALLNEMMGEMNSEERGVHIIELDGSYQMCTKTEMYDYLIKVAVQPKKQILTEVVIETLSIIAYKQPVTKLELEKIRGVKCDHAVNKLVEFGLVEEKGRLEAPGRPMLFGTTEEFLRRFGLPNLDAMPELRSDKTEEFMLEAEEEISLKSND
ncbi:MAG: SMC-Scp complex subunit ScpB [Lachnospiraceae bacterium]|nr:SMC-Scp complex subunit ScpB [Lachnospiraceae bacterium]